MGPPARFEGWPSMANPAPQLPNVDVAENDDGDGGTGPASMLTAARRQVISSVSRFLVLVGNGLSFVFHYFADGTAAEASAEMAAVGAIRMLRLDAASRGTD